jgi:hypothetical protein
MLDVGQPGLSSTPFRLAGQMYAYVGNSPTNLVDPVGLGKRKADQGKPTPSKRLRVTEDEENEENGTIGSRLKRRRSESAASVESTNRRSVRKRQRVTYNQQEEKGIWNGRQRLPWSEETWDALWQQGGNLLAPGGAKLYPCVTCGENFKRKKGKAKNFATIDHIVDFKKYINENAEPEHDGRISTDSATKAYNDLNNLQSMCRNCNSSKNAKKGVFD